MRKIFFSVYMALAPVYIKANKVLCNLSTKALAIDPRTFNTNKEDEINNITNGGLGNVLNNDTTNNTGQGNLNTNNGKKKDIDDQRCKDILTGARGYLNNKNIEAANKFINTKMIELGYDWEDIDAFKKKNNIPTNEISHNNRQSSNQNDSNGKLEETEENNKTTYHTNNNNTNKQRNFNYRNRTSSDEHSKTTTPGA